MKQIIRAALFILLSSSVWATGWAPDDPLVPTGDSTTDTVNLQTMLHDSRLSEGGTLYLGPGVFKIHGVVGRQSLDNTAPSFSTDLFNGTIQGAGKGLTTIRAVKGLDGVNFEPVIQPPFPGDPESIRLYAVMMIEQSYLGLKDLTFDSEPELMWDPENAKFLNEWRGHNAYGGRGPISYVLAGRLEPEIELIGTDLINVRFKGTTDIDGSGSPTTGHLYQQWGDFGGVHNIANCEFENSSHGALQFSDMGNATVNVGGGPKDTVEFTNLPEYAALDIRCNSCAVNVSHIKTRDAPAVRFYTLGGHSTLTVKHSDIKTRPGATFGGVELIGWQGDLSFVIEKNKFHSEDSFLWGPIFSDVANQNGLIADNKFTGRGPAAMYMGVYFWNPGNVTIRGNNIDNWETTSDPWGLDTKPIWLGPFIVDSTITGGNNKATVFDEPAYDINWNPLYNDDGKPLTIPGYGTVIPEEEFDNLVLKDNKIPGVK